MSQFQEGPKGSGTEWPVMTLPASDYLKAVLRCPNCSRIASPLYTRRYLEEALKKGELEVRCVVCTDKWTRKLEPDEKTKLRNDLDFLIEVTCG
jgi:hypothetical protein